MEQDSKIVTVHMKDAANLVLVPLLNEDEVQNLAVFCR
jgi:hypothetical protein